MNGTHVCRFSFFTPIKGDVRCRLCMLVLGTQICLLIPLLLIHFYTIFSLWGLLRTRLWMQWWEGLHLQSDQVSAARSWGELQMLVRCAYSRSPVVYNFSFAMHAVDRKQHKSLLDSSAKLNCGHSSSTQSRIVLNSNQHVMLLQFDS